MLELRVVFRDFEDRGFGSKFKNREELEFVGDFNNGVNILYLNNIRCLMKLTTFFFLLLFYSLIMSF